ncbi:MAG: hypothetical protein AUK44_04680 [Porphyromonadaceae bacterium CG2_30_38_12]|nr:MAG: hypothetical protein AUK44_04680 [Porphyromonadaceae bacterium CG2_30_38_12]
MFGRAIVKLTMFTANIAVILLLLTTLVASKLSPHTFVLPAYSTLIFPLTIAMNIFFVVFWLVARKWYFLLSLLLSLYASKPISETIPVHFGKNAQVMQGKSIRVMSYNTMLFGHLVKHDTKHKNKIIQTILDNNADIVCVQEFAVSPKKTSDYLTLNDVMISFKHYPYKHIEYRKNKNWKRWGIATFSKYPIVEKKKISKEGDYGVSIYSDIKIGKDTIRLFNNHLESNRLTERDKHMPIQLKDNFDSDHLSGTTKKLSQKLNIAYKRRALQADKVAAEIAQSPYKVLVCGDFNDVPVSYTYTKIKGKLNDAFAESGLGLGWTLNLSIYRFRIDYILYDSTYFQLQNFRIGKQKDSDHYPIESNFILKTKHITI